MRGQSCKIRLSSRPSSPARPRRSKDRVERGLASARQRVGKKKFLLPPPWGAGEIPPPSPPSRGVRTAVAPHFGCRHRRGLLCLMFTRPVPSKGADRGMSNVGHGPSLPRGGPWHVQRCAPSLPRGGSLHFQRWKHPASNGADRGMSKRWTRREHKNTPKSMTVKHSGPATAGPDATLLNPKKSRAAYCRPGRYPS